MLSPQMDLVRVNQLGKILMTNRALRTDMNVKLTLSNFKCEVELIEKLVKAEVESVHLKGEPLGFLSPTKKEYFYPKDKNGSIKKWKFNYCEIRSMLKDEGKLEEHIIRFFIMVKKLRDNEKKIGPLEIAVRCTAYLQNSEYRPDLTIGHKTLEKLGELGCDLDLDIY